MSLRIIEEKAKLTMAGPGINGYDAEVTVVEWDGDEFLGKYYVHANSFEGEAYTVAEKSMYDWLTNKTEEDPGEIDFLEQYANLEDAKDSKFYEIFKIANRMINELD